MGKGRVLRWLLVICSVLLLIIPLLSGCRAQQTSGETVIYTVGVLEFPRTKNPFAALGAKTDFNALTQVYEPLLAHTDNFNTALPILAKRWEYDTATKTWTFHLDEKAKFSDGTAVTASDVKYSWDTTLNVAKLFPTALLMIKSITVADAQTVKFELNQPYVDFLQQMGNGLIVPEHVWSKVGDVLKYENTDPIGSGPYFWTEFVTDSHVGFKKNPEYWRGASKIDELVFRFYGAAESMLMGYRKGDIDVMSSMDIKSAVPALLMDPNIKTFFSTGNITNVMMLNQRREPFNLLACREAINIVIDRRSLIDTVLTGYGIIPQQAPIAPCSADSNPKIKWPYEFNTQAERIAMANAKLDAIPGMSAKGTDGIRSYNGNKLTFDFYYSTAPETARMSELIITNVKDIGLQFNAKPMSFTTAYAKVFRHEGKAPLGWDAFFSPSSTFYESWVDPAPKPLAD
ncbi:MAG: ABC transporter substrate-binding protein, partial [Chloroflexi bacterium]|nr:ABC transporter substrate-binding protein [Chloroflexota bacterium]